MSRPATDGPGPSARPFAAFAAALALGLAAPAAAETPAGTFSWVRAAGADVCPARERLVEALDRALGKPLLAALEGRAVEAVIRHGAAGWDVTIYWRAPDGTAAGTREIHDDAAGCDGAVTNTVTSITVALTADAVDAPSRRPPAASAAPAPPAAPPAPPATATSTPAGPDGPPPAPAPAPAAPGDPRTGDVLFGGVLAVGWLPGVGYGTQLVAEPLSSGRLRFALVATALAETAQQLPGVSAGFAATEFGVDLCAVLVAHPRRWVEAAACGGARAGVVQTFVYSGPKTAGGGHGSFAVEVGAELRSNPLGPLLIGLTLAGRLNATRYTLSASTPGPALYTQDVGGFVSTLRVGVHFP